MLQKKIIILQKPHCVPMRESIQQRIHDILHVIFSDDICRILYLSNEKSWIIFN